jgi:hypothetical protein
MALTRSHLWVDGNLASKPSSQPFGVGCFFVPLLDNLKLLTLTQVLEENLTYVLMNESHLQFCEAYGIVDTRLFNQLYEIDEVILFMPLQPSPREKEALQSLLGVQGETYGYMDYVKSNNTFELIMQWRELTGNL